MSLFRCYTVIKNFVLLIIINNKVTILKLLDAIFVKITYKKRVVNNM